MDLTKQYFITSINFNFINEFNLIERQDGFYLDQNTNTIYRKRELYDCGWGQETGYEIVPSLNFRELISLIETYRSDIQIQEKSIRFSNLLGAVSVIMQDHIEEFIDFLSSKLESDYFDDNYIRINFKWFMLSTQKTYEAKMMPGGIKTKSYEDVIKNYPRWKAIEFEIINQIYR